MQDKDLLNIFMTKFNELDGLTKKIFTQNGKTSTMIMYINDLPEPYCSKMNTLRIARNLYVHGSRFGDETVIQINVNSIQFIEERIVELENRVNSLDIRSKIDSIDNDVANDENEKIERTLQDGESLNQKCELYSLYGWKLSETVGLDELDCETKLVFSKDKTIAGREALDELWDKRNNKYCEYEILMQRNKRLKKIKKIRPILNLFSFLLYFASFAVFVITKNIASLGILFGLGLVLYISTNIIFNLLQRKINTEVEKTVKAINDIDLMATNITSYLK